MNLIDKKKKFFILYNYIIIQIIDPLIFT
jgi:hypothetical protein